ncbi:MAG: hypothetical protein ISR47_04685 [Rhodospirillales bacterium]|nr:hypothetical protein [Rhodospirillales bacterium]
MKSIAIASAMLLVGSAAFADGEHEAPIKELADSEISVWVGDPVLISAVNAQNAKNASLSQSEINALDKKWRAETNAGSKPLIDAVLGNELSAFLQKIRAAKQGLFTEIFVMDNRGLNVGQSDITSDYWQGDEAKFQKTYPLGPAGLHIGEVEEDESSQRFQSQLSMTVVDPGTNRAIGAITIGIDVEILLQ